MLEPGTEGEAGGGGAHGANVESDGADSVGDRGAGPDAMILVVGLGSNVG